MPRYTKYTTLYQDCSWYERLWRCRHYWYVPFDAFQLYRWNSEDLGLKGCWGAAVGHSQFKMNYVYKWPDDFEGDIVVKFFNLRRQWHEETKHTSDFTQIITNPSYQKIIDLGQEIVPYILLSLEKEPDHWGWALKEITHENLVPEGNEGDIHAISEAWLKWGREKGLI